MAQYGKASYWDERYTKDPESFDWYQRYSGLSDKIANFAKKDSRILMLGCGNSRLTEDLYEDGYKNIANIDISKVVIDLMKEKHKDKETLSWDVMDACKLDFPEESFDCIIDKGTMDSILCGEGSTSNVAKVCNECIRILKPDGCFFMVSYGVPDNRLGYLESDEYPWKVSVMTVPKPTVSAAAIPDSKDANNVHYVYCCVKESKASAQAEE